jgi:phytoene dehydrogenase-like protein
MGAVTAALQRAAEAAGVTIRTGAAVSRIVMESGRAVGVTLNGGDELRAPLIVSGINPRTTFFDLVGPTNLDTGIVRRIKNIRMRGNAAKLHLALDGLPPFRGVAAAELAGRLVIAPNVAYVEKAFNPAKYGDYSGAPAMEIIVPSASDPSFAPAGRHVLSAIVQYAPYRLKAGWSAGKADFLKTVLTTLNAYAPGIGERIVASELLTPADLEQTYRMPGGHWHHGELAVDQMLMLRPVPGAAQYETPVPGLYLCGAGSHPGGGVMGAAGHNAARHILARGA